MPDLGRTPPRADPPPPRRGAPGRASMEEVRAAAERAALHPEGLAILRDAPLECAAVLLGLDPRRLERVRAALAEPELLAEALRAHALAADRRRAAPASPPPPPADPAALLAAARGRENGLAVLLEASAECAAVVFGVHPGLVLRARALAARAPDAPRST